MQHKKAFVITGGPGMGKTSIINYLELTGYCTLLESGRQIIKRELETGGDKLPWKNRSGFALEMFRHALEDFKLINKKQANIFLDRGLPDAIGYLILCGLPVPNEMWLAAKKYRYHQKVFITPPWRQIYINDQERKQSFEEATKTYIVMNEVYNKLGYEVIEVPKTTISNRVRYILSTLGIISAQQSYG